MRPTLAVSILFLAAACSAQMSSAATLSVSPPPEPNGVVTGRVFCGDTGRPARFASVSLMPVPDAAGAKLKKPNLGSTSKPAPGTTTVSTAVDTALDGSYTLTHVTPGTYYVLVKKDGYISPLTMFSKQLEEPTDQIRALIEEALPRVQVEQDSIARADVQLRRGAAVSGTISYDDGTPASGITVTLLHRERDAKWVPVEGSGPVNSFFNLTNDRGYFRMSSLLPDTYLLQAHLDLGDEKTYSTTDSAGHTSNKFFRKSFRFTLSFYGDGTPHIEQATGFTLRGSDERTGQDMTLPVSKLHKLTGRVAVGSNGHLVNAASVELLYAGKTSLAYSDIDREDGLFHFEYVPEGDYTLRVTNARDVTWEPADPPQPGTTFGGFPLPDKERILETYGNVDMPLLLRGDMTGIIATVSAKQNNQSEAR